MSPVSKPASLLAAFVEWSAAHITGDEKGQARIFLDRLFQACDYWPRLIPGRPRED